jgi:hypothetical protein
VKGAIDGNSPIRVPGNIESTGGNVVSSQNVTGAHVMACISMFVEDVAVSTVGVCVCSPAVYFEGEIWIERGHDEFVGEYFQVYVRQEDDIGDDGSRQR